LHGPDVSEGSDLLAVKTAFDVVRQDAFKRRGAAEPDYKGAIWKFD
jgi:hypothetical protein